eukprot:6421322-Pyramimonas_sp.AAC.1
MLRWCRNERYTSSRRTTEVHLMARTYCGNLTPGPSDASTRRQVESRPSGCLESTRRVRRTQYLL